MIKDNEDKLSSIGVCPDALSFVVSFLSAFDFPVSAIEKAKEPFSIDGKAQVGKQICFFDVPENEINLAYQQWLRTPKSAKAVYRFAFFIDGVKFLAQDTATGDSVSGTLQHIGLYFDFFLPLLGKENKSFSLLGKPDVKAGEEIAHIRTQMVLDNGENEQQNVGQFIFNLFVLLHVNCFLGEKGYISQYIYRNVSDDGRNLPNVFNEIIESSPSIYSLSFSQLFGMKNTSGLYVSKDTFASIRELFALDWSAIDTDAIGSIVQNTKNSEGEFENFTSKENVMKLLGPLFLNKLYARLSEAGSDRQKLLTLASDISAMKFFDPCCGTGSFLICAYREVDDVLKTIAIQLREPKPQLNPTHFLGLDGDSLSTSIAKISFGFTVFSRTRSSSYLALAVGRSIVTCQPVSSDWLSLDFEFDDSTFIFGNIDYSGSRKLTDAQKRESEPILSEVPGYGELDYSACWFIKAAKLARTKKCQIAFVCTNSILQGEQVGILWGWIFEQYGLRISFVYKPFKWSNGSKNKTGVTVIIIGLSSSSDRGVVYDGLFATDYPTVGPYYSRENVIVKRQRTVLSCLPLMVKGDMPYDQGNLSNISTDQKKEIIQNYPNSEKFFKRLVGSEEFINDITRWCLWIHESESQEALNIPPIAERINKTRDFRLSCKDPGAKKLALTPYKFRESNETKTYSIVVPSVSSENRPYIPIGFVDSGYIVSNLSFVIYDPEMWVLGVLLSKMHNLWIRTVCGRLEMRLRYSNLLGYNTFPMPNLSQTQKDLIAECARNVIKQREEYPEMTLGKCTQTCQKASPAFIEC
jgi:hypothetical protein